MTPSTPDAESFRELLRTAAPDAAARAVLGGVLARGGVALRIVEVEAYGGPAGSRYPDAAAHTWPGPTARNEVMFGDAGHLYVYLSHGIHTCVNITCRAPGEGGGVLLRAARVETGREVVDSRRSGVPPDRLARGPGNLGRTLGVDLGFRGIDLLDPTSEVVFRPDPIALEDIRSGPRVGVSREPDRPWRFWIAGAREVSAYRRSPRAESVSVPRRVAAHDDDGGQWQP